MISDLDDVMFVKLRDLRCACSRIIEAGDVLIFVGSSSTLR